MPTPTGPVPLPAEARTPAAGPAAPTDVTVVVGRRKPIARVRFEGSGYTFEITKPGTYGLGRANDAPLRVTSPMVSRKQVQIVLSADRLAVTIEDLGGANGTIVNGTKVERTALKDGDDIQIGDVTLRVTVESQARA